MTDHVITLRGSATTRTPAALTGPALCTAAYRFDVARLKAKGYSTAAADTFQVRVFGSRMRIIQMAAEVVQADTGSSTRTVGVGDGDAATTWFTALDLKTAALTVAADATAAGVAKQVLYGIDDADAYLLLTLNHDLVDAIVKFQWAYIPIMPDQDVEA